MKRVKIWNVRLAVDAKWKECSCQAIVQSLSMCGVEVDVAHLNGAESLINWVGSLADFGLGIYQLPILTGTQETRLNCLIIHSNIAITTWAHPIQVL